MADHTTPATTDDLLVLVQALDATARPEDQAAKPASIEGSVRRVEIAFELKAVADRALRESISDARSTGVPWQVVGDALGITRQAAFQRFGHPINSAGGPPMKTEDLDALIPRSEGIYHHLAAGEYTAVGRQMTFVVQRLLHEKKVMGVWSQVTDDVGALETLGESFARPSGANTVVETPLSFEAGDYVGRIAYNGRGKIVGMLILPPDNLASAPF